MRNTKRVGKDSEAATQLINYYTANASRMDYAYYRTIGCGIIRSGAIEWGHKTVVQRRMKQAGQRWSRPGAQHMLNLRTARLNNDWGKVTYLTQKNCKAAA